MAILFDGNRISNVSVAYGFVFNPSGYNYETSYNRFGHSRLKGKRVIGLEFDIPIVIKKDVSDDWEEIERNLRKNLYKEGFRSLFLDPTSSRKLLVEVVSITVSERYQEGGKGMLTVVSKYPMYLGEDQKKLITSAESSKATFEVDTSSPWKAEVLFSKPTSRFHIESNRGLYVSLSYDFVEGDSLIITYDGLTVDLNGEDLRHSVRLASNFTLLTNGEHTFNTNHDCTIICFPLIY